MLRTKKNKFNHKKTMKNYITKLKKKYPETKYDSLINKHDTYNTTYGEMTYNGMEKLISSLSKHNVNKCNSFMDLGSGRGSICLYMASKPHIKKSIGIELIKERFDDANQLKNNINNKHYTSKVNFINDDMFNVINDHVYDINPYLIWISNLLFTPEITNKIYDLLINNLPNGSIICSSRSPSEYNQEQCKLIDTISIPMSWNIHGNDIYAYQIHK